MLWAMALMNPAVIGRATNAVALAPGIVEAETSHAPAGDAAVVAPDDTAVTMALVDAGASCVDPCTATMTPLDCITPSTSSVPITDASSMSVVRSVGAVVTLCRVASWRPTPAMKLASDARWPTMRFAAMDALSAALFSDWARALLSASINGTTAIVNPATKITVANFNENDAPRQMPPTRRTPRITPFQLDRRISASEATATVAATRTLENAINATAPPPDLPALAGRRAGIVSAGGASTGGCGLPPAPTCSRAQATLTASEMPAGAAPPPVRASEAVVAGGGATRLGIEVGVAVGAGVRVGWAAMRSTAACSIDRHRQDG